METFVVLQWYVDYINGSMLRYTLSWLIWKCNVKHYIPKVASRIWFLGDRPQTSDITLG